MGSVAIRDTGIGGESVAGGAGLADVGGRVSVAVGDVAGGYTLIAH